MVFRRAVGRKRGVVALAVPALLLVLISSRLQNHCSSVAVVSAFRPTNNLNNCRQQHRCHGSAFYPFTRILSPSSSCLLAGESQQHQQQSDDSVSAAVGALLQRTLRSTAIGLAITGLSWSGGAFTGPTSTTQPANAAADPAKIVSCLVTKCPVPFTKCITNPLCLANVACINTCNGRPDEIDCQIKCGDLFENDVTGEFNKCAVSDMDCVPQQPDDGSYPVPSKTQVVPTFDTKLFEGRWYISAGQNPLFDTFPCQVHFFSETGPGKFVGKLNWRIEEPDGEFFTRDALQAFVQDPDMPAHLLNHDNEYLHYQDDWYIIDYEYDNNGKGVPPFAFVYYRGSNDAWDGYVVLPVCFVSCWVILRNESHACSIFSSSFLRHPARLRYGGVVVYTRDAALPKSLLPRLRKAAEKVGFDFDKDFVLTDNSCPTELSEGERAVLRERFAGKVVLQTEKQLQAEAVRLRGNAVNGVKAQKIFFENGLEATQEAFKKLEQKTQEFEAEFVKDAEAVVEDVEEVIVKGAKAPVINKSDK